MKQKTAKTNWCWSYYVSLGLVLAIVFSGCFYLVRITSAATNGFKISAQENQIKDLKLTNQLLKEKINILKNLAVLQEKSLAQGLTPALKIEYLSVKDNNVAIIK